MYFGGYVEIGLFFVCMWNDFENDGNYWCFFLNLINLLCGVEVSFKKVWFFFKMNFLCMVKV